MAGADGAATAVWYWPFFISTHKTIKEAEQDGDYVGCAAELLVLFG